MISDEVKNIENNCKIKRKIYRYIIFVEINPRINTLFQESI